MRPLMVDLVECIRKLCIPDESNVDVWRTIPKIQRVLIREVGAFEDRLVSMGYMNAKGGVQKFAAASSPSGLSVLVNQDDVGSPIDVNLTTNRDSPIEISSPPTNEGREGTAVRSSLSQIAKSFLQAYSENQRSKILRRCRSILDNTDYHNSIQVAWKLRVLLVIGLGLRPYRCASVLDLHQILQRRDCTEFVRGFIWVCLPSD